jgi:hypothetical protein
MALFSPAIRRFAPALLAGCLLVAPAAATAGDEAGSTPAKARRGCKADVEAEAPGGAGQECRPDTAPAAAQPGDAAALKPAEPHPLLPPDLPAYQKEIEGIRSLTFKAPVASGRQSLAEFRAFIEQDLDQDLPAARAGCISRSFARLGLLPEGFDLRKAFSDMFVAQVAAYYDPYKQTFYVIHADLPEALLRPTVVHELTHALQDQRFGLAARVKALHAVDSDDLENAFRFLAEGEASYVMILSTLRQQAGDSGSDASMVDSMIDFTGKLGREGLLEQAGSAGETLGPEVKQALGSIRSYPDFLTRILLDPYFDGMQAIHRVQRAGGWAAVNELWRNPPTSTEQLLHPEKLAAGRRDEPVKVAVPDLSASLGPGYASACENTLGEFETEILLEQTPTPCGGAAACVERARRAAAGWGGDRYRAFEKSGAGTVVVWKTVWDTEQDAAEFEQALGATPARLTARRGKDVLVVAGGSADQARAVIEALYPAPATDPTPQGR